MPRDSMTVREACAYLRVHPSTIYKLLRRGEIPYFKVGPDVRFSAEALDRWRRERGGDEASGALVLNPVGSLPSSAGAEAPLVAGNCEIEQVTSSTGGATVIKTPNVPYKGTQFTQAEADYLAAPRSREDRNKTGDAFNAIWPTVAGKRPNLVDRWSAAIKGRGHSWRYGARFH